MWHPDGWGWRARIGILTPHGSIGPESELQAMAPPGVSIHAGRARFPVMEAGSVLDEAIDLAGIRAFVEPPGLDDAAELLAAAPLHVIAYGFTSSSYTGGLGEDEVLRTRLEQRTGGIPVVTTCAAAALALKALGAARLALFSPPWFSDALTRLGADWFERQGTDVVYAESVAVPGGQMDTHPGQLYDWVRGHVPGSADAVFVGGNGYRAVGAIQALEEDLGLPVLTANQVLLWHALLVAGVHPSVTGYGRVFALDVPATGPG